MLVRKFQKKLINIISKVIKDYMITYNNKNSTNYNFFIFYFLTRGVRSYENIKQLKTQNQSLEQHLHSNPIGKLQYKLQLNKIKS